MKHFLIFILQITFISCAQKNSQIIEDRDSLEMTYYFSNIFDKNEFIQSIYEICENNYYIETNNGIYQWIPDKNYIKFLFEQSQEQSIVFKTNDFFWFQTQKSLISWDLEFKKKMSYSVTGYCPIGLLKDNIFLGLNGQTNKVFTYDIKSNRIMNSVESKNSPILRDYCSSSNDSLFSISNDSIFFYTLNKKNEITIDIFPRNVKSKYLTVIQNNNSELIYFDEINSLYIGDYYQSKIKKLFPKKENLILKSSDFFIEGDKKCFLTKRQNSYYLLVFGKQSIRVIEMW